MRTSDPSSARFTCWLCSQPLRSSSSSFWVKPSVMARFISSWNAVFENPLIAEALLDAFENKDIAFSRRVGGRIRGARVAMISIMSLALP